MMKQRTDADATAAAAPDATTSPPDEKQADTAPDSAAEKQETISREEHKAILERRLSGQGKRLKELEDRLAAEAAAKQAEAEQKKVAEGRVAEVLQTRDAEVKALKDENKALAAELESFKQAEADRRETLAKDNKRRLKALPEQWHGFVLPSDPDVAAAQLSAIEANAATSATTATAPARVKVTPQGSGANGSVEQRIQQKQAALRDRYMGRR